jgi:putative ABC transport system ATP-binding protein
VLIPRWFLEVNMVLVAENLTKAFMDGRQENWVLKGASLSLQRGEVVALEGPSGSGKTTLLSILGCILTPTSGSLWIEGQAVPLNKPSALPAIRRRSIGFVFQQFNLFPALTALENVEYALNIRGQKKNTRQPAIELLETVGLAERLHYLPRDLSGGQKQRVAIARALVGGASVIFADEPTASLDHDSSEQILDLFKELGKRENRALLIVTHDPRVRRICDRILRIQEGVIIA